MERAPEDKMAAYHVALSMDIDAFLWITNELKRIWEELVLCANNPDFFRIHQIAADLSYVVDESNFFATDAQNDLVEIEKEEADCEQDTFDSGNG
jgi:hypothetical protein